MTELEFKKEKQMWEGLGFLKGIDDEYIKGRLTLLYHKAALYCMETSENCNSKLKEGDETALFALIRAIITGVSEQYEFDFDKLLDIYHDMCDIVGGGEINNILDFQAEGCKLTVNKIKEDFDIENKKADEVIKKMLNDLHLKK